MASTSQRMLTLLSLLGSGGSWSGAALAERLGVSTRTVRRDIDVLRELGYAVHAGKGRTGNYRFGSVGMPPLLLDEEQAVATALALQTAPTIVAGVGDAATRALTTLRAALSPQLRAEVDNVRITSVANAWEFRSPPIAADVLTAVGSAVRKGHLLRVDVLSADGRRPSPGAPDFCPPVTVEPHDLVVWAGRWYLVVFELGALQWVVRRVDRLHPYGPTGTSFIRRDTPYDDAGRYVRGRPDRGDTPAGWQCTGSAVLQLAAAVVARWAPGGSAVEELSMTQCRITLSAWSWAGVAGLLATFDAPLSCVEPLELREAMQVVSQRFIARDCGPTTLQIAGRERCRSQRWETVRMTVPALLAELVPDPAEPDAVYEAFALWAQRDGLTLYPAQEEALLEIVGDAHVILSTPTGSGKSMVALGAQFAALSRGQRSFYTAPIKALVSEKFFALVAAFGAQNVGMMTGDATVNGNAPVICCTAEILANLALREGPSADVGLVVMDEFHFYADPERGWAWQVPLLELTRTQFVLMSATLGDVTALSERLQERTGREVAHVTSTERPVPLSFSYVTTPVHETLEELLTTHQAPVYVVHFTQAAAIEQAQALMSINVCTREEKDAIAELIGGFRFTAGFGKTLSRLVRHGIGVHHAGMLPKYRRLVELLAQSGLLKVVCGTDTLGVGINVPIRTVLFTGLTKYDGTRTRHLKAREFHQIAGRAGRAGFDVAGTVVVQAPDHDVENARRVAKAGDDPKKLKRVERKKAPEGFVSWGAPTFERLVGAEPETLHSTFRVSHSMLLQVVQRPGDFFAHMRGLLLGNDEPRVRQRTLVRQAIRIFRALERAGTMERLTVPDATGRTVRLTVELQRDFALDQPLSPFAVAALELLDPESPSHTLDLVSMVEAILDDPRQVLQAQRSKAKGEAVAEMKQQGIEYEERMELLEDVTWPQPLAEELAAAFETYRAAHPWVADEELSPKSIARDLSERAMTFVEYVGFYGLARSEGLLLRYLADAYKALRRTVPSTFRTEDVEDTVAWLGELVRQVDSSLLEEWEALANPVDDVPMPSSVPVDVAPPPVTANVRAFRVLVRNALFRRVELMALRRWIDLGDLDPGFGQDAWEEAVQAYFAEHPVLGTGPDARGPLLFEIAVEPGQWRVRQTLDDPAGDHDWAITALVDLAASDEAGEAVLAIESVEAASGLLGA